MPRLFFKFKFADLQNLLCLGGHLLFESEEGGTIFSDISDGAALCRALEAFLIDWHLRRGMTPYCHVVRGNAASMALQKKLGLMESAYPAIWLR